MIIKTDVMNVSMDNPRTVQRQAAHSTSRNIPDHPRPTRATEQSRLKTAAKRLGMERALGDALSIAQMSQNIIQQAVSISLRLKSIASEAISTGTVNAGALSEVMADMRNTLGNDGGDVATPLKSYAVPAGHMVQMPDIRGEIRSLNDIGADMDAGNYSQKARIEATERALGEKMTAFRQSEGKIINLMRETGAGYAGAGRLQANELASKAGSFILNNPDSALAAQGNISHSSAGRLMV